MIPLIRCPSGPVSGLAGREEFGGFGADILPVLGSHGRRGPTLEAFGQQRLQFVLRLAPFILTDEFADIFTDTAVAARADLAVHEVLELIGQRDVHGLHRRQSDGC